MPVNKESRNQNNNDLTTGGLRYFLQNVFKTLNPTTDFLWNWHLDYLCDVLEDVYNGNIKRLMINIPPRYLKSVICSVAFPAWVLGKDPTKRIIVVSYSKQLAIKHSIDTRIIMQSNWYKEYFPNTIIADDQNEKNKFTTTMNGFRLATSTGGTLTGEGGDILIVDDPHNPVNIFNKRNRTKVANWFSSVFSSRLNNKKKGAIIIVMQRLHEEDLCGYLLEKINTNTIGNSKIKKSSKNQWFHVNLQAIAEYDFVYKIQDKIYKDRHNGDILHPKMESIKDLTRIKTELGEYNFSAQYQQSPISIDGNMIRHKWIKYFDLKEFNLIIQKNNLPYYISIDCASGIGTENDFTALSVFVCYNNKFYLCCMCRFKQSYPELKQSIVDIINQYNPLVILIEDKSNGSSLIQDLQVNMNNIIPIKPLKSKEYRVNQILTMFEAGNILFAKNQDWLEELEAEILSFPNCKHDDQLDTISQFINWYNDTKRLQNNNVRIRNF